MIGIEHDFFILYLCNDTLAAATPRTHNVGFESEWKNAQR
jgi:hypothetical protein